MESKAKNLSKSRFTLAAECPTKLFYVDKESEFENRKIDNDFLKSLAKGGFQVGALARCYYPGGIEIKPLDRAAAIAATEPHLEASSVTLFEPAFALGHAFARVDILDIDGDRWRLLEVKAKSYAPDESFFSRERGLKAPRITDSWMPYLLDVTFQTHLMRTKFPTKTITPYLVLADKTKVATVDGLNQKFTLEADGRTVRMRGDVSPAALGEKVLVEMDVSEEVEHLLHGRRYGLGPGFEGETLGFGELVDRLGDAVARGERLTTRLGAHCGSCEFRRLGSAHDYGPCWEPTLTARRECIPVLEVWATTRKDAWIEDGKVCLQDLALADLGRDGGPKDSGLSRVERQWCQIEMARTPGAARYLDREGLAAQRRGWKYPLHFIDFETIALALPFHRGRRPYETHAFQFSHHRVDRSGKITHQGEFLHRERGKFPNYAFLRALKADLENDDGTIFRYAPHENTTLNAIVRQLSADETVADREELIGFVHSITRPGKGEERPPGPREMVDLWDLVKRFYLLPEMKGSNSLKIVLPTTLAASDFLRKRYSGPVYGTSELPSLNFQNHTWLVPDPKGGWKNPYDLLPDIFEGISDAQLEAWEDDVDVKEGAGAMMAYAQMQLTDTSPEKIDALATKLLRYCELDTLAMVMLWEAWQHWLDGP